jgi:hypothetical protein
VEREVNGFLLCKIKDVAFVDPAITYGEDAMEMIRRFFKRFKTMKRNSTIVRKN